MSERNQKAIIERITQQMEKENLDALILTSGDAVFYATGYAARDLYKNGQTGGCVAVVTKDGKAGLVVSEFARRTAEMAVDGVEIQSYPTWIYIADYAVEGMEKEVQPDLNKTYKMALNFLPEKRSDLRIGVQPSYLTPYAWKFLAETFGEKNLFDVKQILIEARVIKTPSRIFIQHINLRRRTERVSVFCVFAKEMGCFDFGRCPSLNMKYLIKLNNSLHRHFKCTTLPVIVSAYNR